MPVWIEKRNSLANTQELALRDRFTEFDYFRGITISLIVLVHSFTIITSDIPISAVNLLVGSSCLFVFMSGFFFHRIYSENFDYKKFILKKTRNVAVPCFVFSVIIVAIKIVAWTIVYRQTGEQVMTVLLEQMSRGYVFWPYWYIPFIMLVFFFSPVHVWFAKLEVSKQIPIFLMSTVAANYVHRSADLGAFLQHVIFFTPFYLLGILYSQHLKWLNENSKALFTISFLGFVMTFTMQTYMFRFRGNYNHDSLDMIPIDLMFWQKLFLCVVLVGVCSFIAKRISLPWLQVMANASFAIYFIHGLFIEVFKILYSDIIGVAEIGSSVADATAVGICFIVTLIGSLLVAKFLKHYLGENSRPVIGW